MVSERAKVIIHVGGHDFHPVHEQAALLAEWLAPLGWCRAAESLAALEHLGECDLLVFLGMYYGGWEGRYRAPGDAHKRRIERYVASGRPIIFAHGAIVSYADWPRFAELAGFAWPARRPTFALPGEYLVRVARGLDDPIRDDVSDHVLHDAPPVDVRVADDMRARVHAFIERSPGDGATPMWVTGQGGRTPGSGKTAFIGAGHDLRGFAHPMTRQMWVNTARWCLSTASVRESTC
jgi:hypothetical protein